MLFYLITTVTCAAPIHDDEYLSCVCFEDDVTVIEYARAFNSLQDATKRFAQHMTDTRFDDYNPMQMLQDQCNTSQNSEFRYYEFNNYYTTLNESLCIMDNALTKLQVDLDTFAENYYDWMLIIAGYVIKREFN